MRIRPFRSLFHQGNSFIEGEILACLPLYLLGFDPFFIRAIRSWASKGTKTDSEPRNLVSIPFSSGQFVHVADIFLNR